MHADGALIAEDVYPERWDTERYYHVQSVRSGSYAERSGWKIHHLIMSMRAALSADLGAPV